MLRGSHEPGAGVVRDAGLRPLLQRRDESTLPEIFGDADVAHDPSKTAMSLGDSILQTASIARCVSGAVTATDHTIL